MTLGQTLFELSCATQQENGQTDKGKSKSPLLKRGHKNIKNNVTKMADNKRLK
jgi:hypothetical protein